MARAAPWGRAAGGRVLIIDDVMSAGTAARESIALIQAAGATPHAMAIALDRQEKATENGQDVEHSAVQYVRRELGMQKAIAKLADLLQYLAADGGDAQCTPTTSACWPIASAMASMTEAWAVRGAMALKTRQ